MKKQKLTDKLFQQGGDLLAAGQPPIDYTHSKLILDSLLKEEEDSLLNSDVSNFCMSPDKNLNFKFC